MNKANVYAPLEAVNLTLESVFAEQDSLLGGIETGIAKLDEKITPLKGITTLHAYTDHGKTELGNIIQRHNTPLAETNEIVVEVLLEESIEEQGIKQISQETTPLMSVFDIVRTKFTPEEKKKFTRAAMKLATKPVWRIGNSQEDHRKKRRITVPMLHDALDWIVESQGKKIRFIKIDYLQRFKMHKTGNERLVFADMMDRLDSIAQGYAPILLLAQSGREADKQKRMPYPSEIQETSSAEQFSRNVMSIYRPIKHYEKDSMWDFGGVSYKVDPMLFMIGIQKWKNVEYTPMYRAFMSNEKRDLVHQEPTKVKLN